MARSFHDPDVVVVAVVVDSVGDNVVVARVVRKAMVDSDWVRPEKVLFWLVATLSNQSVAVVLAVMPPVDTLVAVSLLADDPESKGRLLSILAEIEVLRPYDDDLALAAHKHVKLQVVVDSYMMDNRSQY